MQRYLVSLDFLLTWCILYLFIKKFHTVTQSQDFSIVKLFRDVFEIFLAYDTIKQILFWLIMTCSFWFVNPFLRILSSKPVVFDIWFCLHSVRKLFPSILTFHYIVEFESLFLKHFYSCHLFFRFSIKHLRTKALWILTCCFKISDIFICIHFTKKQYVFSVYPSSSLALSFVDMLITKL